MNRAAVRATASSNTYQPRILIRAEGAHRHSGTSVIVRRIDRGVRRVRRIPRVDGWVRELRVRGDRDRGIDVGRGEGVETVIADETVVWGDRDSGHSGLAQIDRRRRHDHELGLSGVAPDYWTFESHWRQGGGEGLGSERDRCRQGDDTHDRQGDPT
jgi:hypothetical protein